VIAGVRRTVREKSRLTAGLALRQNKDSAGLVSLGLLFYLTYALLRPEQF